MRKLIVQQWITVDNIAAEEDGGLSFVSGEPFDDAVTDNPFQNAMMAFSDTVDTLILGANTYQQSKNYWPHAEDQGEWGRRLNATTKYVASSTLAEAPWGDFKPATVTADAAATVRELKAQDGKDLWLWGSLTLMHQLMAEGLVDEVLLLVCPAARGKGRRIFEDRQDLRLLDAVTAENGVMFLRYALKN